MAANPQNLGDEVCQRLPVEDEDQSDLASQPEDLQQQQQQPAFYGTFLVPPPHLIAYTTANQIHSRDSQSSNEPTKTVTRPKRYRLVFLITLGFDVGLVIFLSIISFVVCVHVYVLQLHTVTAVLLVLERRAWSWRWRVFSAQYWWFPVWSSGESQ